MDFQKMVRQFRENVADKNKPQPLNEMASEDYRAAAEERVGELEAGTAVIPLAWGQLFPEAGEGTNSPAPDGMATRMILDFIPNEMKMALEIGKKLTKLGWEPAFDDKEVTQKKTVRNDQGEEVRVETKESIAQLDYHKTIEKIIPKGPRAGEKIKKTQVTKLGKLIQKHGTPEEKVFWAKEQIRFTNIDTANEYFLKPWMREYKDEANAMAVMITRHPIDVLRLSDFSNMKYSCWSEGGQYGHCSKDEALTGGPVAFMVPKAEIEKVSLQDLQGLEEVFSDTDIGSEGKTTAEPKSRLRLISLRNEDGEELAIPAQKVYGVNVPGFKGIVSDFMWKAQKDIIVRAGSAEDFVEELSNGFWERTGGAYSDQEQSGRRLGELIAKMIPEAAVSSEQLGAITGTNIPYDVYSGSDEDIDNQIDQVQDQLDQLSQRWGNALTHVSVWMEVEQADEENFYINTSADVQINIDAPTTEQEIKYGLNMIPTRSNEHELGDNYWGYKRGLENTIDEAVEKTDDIDSYQYQDLGIESGHDGSIVFNFQLESAEIENMGVEGVSDVEYWLESTVREWDGAIDELRRNIILALQAEEYLPPAKGFASAKADVNKEGVPNTFSNFEVEMMDPANPSEGIVIGTKEQGRLNFALGVYDTVDKATGAQFNLIDVLNGKDHIYDPDAEPQRLRATVKHTIYQALIGELQKIEDEAEEYAKQQLNLPLEQPTDPQGELDLGKEYEREKGEPQSYNRDRQQVPEFNFTNSAISFRFDPIETMESKVIIGIHMSFDVAVDATEENYGAIKAFVTYLDGNKDRLVEALQNLIDPYYEKLRTASVAMQKGEHERVKQKVADAEAAGKDPLAAGAYYKAEDLYEAEEKSSARLYQVVLTLRVNKPIRDIAGKLNRIRAIEGVTVVSHETDEDVLHRGDIVAKVKFHVRKDSTTPMTYINQTLVPEINSSQMVPEVKVLSVVVGTLKKI